MFLSVLHLATSTNRDGYASALQKSWEKLGLNFYQSPHKSSLSEYRSKVSYKFFEEIFREDIERLRSKRKTFRGFHIYAVDGTDVDLPATDDVLEAGYRGASWSKKWETYYPKMFFVHAYDVLNGLTCHFRFSSKCSERASARDMIGDFEENSIAIYDRLYAGYPVFEKHIKAGNYFLARATVKGKKVAHALRDFIKSQRCDQPGFWDPCNQPGPGLNVRLVKVRHPKTKEMSVFITNIPKEKFTRLEIQELYLKRWQVETSFKDLSDTLKMAQWHSTKINGILQEIFALLWIVNAVKMQMSSFGDPDEIFLSRAYNRSNFKLCLSMTMDNLSLLLKSRFKKFIDMFEFWIRRTREKRKQLGRSYPRTVHSNKRSSFALKHIVARRPRPA